MAENNNHGNTVVIFTGQYIDIARLGGQYTVEQIFLAESAIFYPYTLRGIFGKAISWSICLLLFAATVPTQSLGEVLPIK